MANKTLNTKILQRIDTLANWESANPRLGLGEVGIAVIDEVDSDTGETIRSFKMKIGDAAHYWNELEWLTWSSKEISEALVSDGAGASKIKFNSPLYKSTNVGSALNEVWGYVQDVENAIEEGANECFEIEYSPSHSGLTQFTNAQQVFDYLTDYIDEYAPNLNEVIFDSTGTDLKDSQGVPITNSQIAFDTLYGLTPKNASDLSYQNALSGLIAENTQSAIDELVQIIDDLEASAIKYTNNPDETNAKNVQDVIDALWVEIHTIYDFGVSKELSSFTYDNTKTKIVIDPDDPEPKDELNGQEVMEYCIDRFNKIVQDLDSAIGVTFDNSKTKIALGTELQTATEQLDTALFNLREYVNALKSSQVIHDDSNPDNIITVEGALNDLDDRVSDIEDWNATSIDYDNTTSKLSATNVQTAIDELDSAIDDLILDAEHVTYDDTTSDLGATDVQTAIEKLDERTDEIEDVLDDYDKVTLEKFSTNSDGDLMWGTIKIGGTDDTFHKLASEISYDNTVKGLLTETTVQGAIDDLAQRDSDTNKRIDDLTGSDIAYDNTTSDLEATDIQAAIDEIDAVVDDNKDRLDNLSGDDVAFTPTTTIPQTTVQSAIEQLDSIMQTTILDLKAENVSFDDTVAGLSDDTTTVDTVQKALEAIDAKVDTLNLDAVNITFDPATSTLVSENVQAMGEEIAGRLDAVEKADGVEFVPGTTGMIATDVQMAIEELDERIDTIEDWTADDISFTTQDTSDDALTSTDVRSALDEVNNKLNTIADNKNTAGDVKYDNTNGKITDPTATDVQKALDVLADKISGTDGKISNKAKDIVLTDPSECSLTSLNAQAAFEEIAGRLDDVEEATGVAYDPSPSASAETPLVSTNVQDAITEVNAKLDTIAENKNNAVDIVYSPTATSQFTSGNVAGVIQEISDKLTNEADDITYDNSTSGISATTVQGAIDNILGGLDTNASDIEYDNKSSGLAATDAQGALDELAERTDSIPEKLADVTFDSTVTGWTDIKNGQQAVDKLSKAENLYFDTTFSGLKDDYGNPVDNMQDALDSMYSLYSRFSGQKASYVVYDPTTSGRTGSTNVQNAIDRAFSEIDQAVAKIYDKAEDIKYENDDYPSLTNVKLALDRLLKQVFYVLPEITSFTCVTHSGTTTSTGTTYEVGYNIDSVDFAWTLNKIPSSQLLTGCSITDTDRSATYNTAFNSDKTFKLVAIDREADSSGTYNRVEKEMEFIFYPGVYFGVGAIPNVYDSDFVTGLSGKNLQKDRKGTYAFNAGAGQYCFIAWPTAYGTVTEVNVGGFATSVLSCGTTSVTNVYGDTRTYQIYRLQQASLGSINMVVS